MNISALIPWASRPELGLSLAAGAEILKRNAVEIIVANSGGDADQLRAIVASLWPLKVSVVDCQANRFNKGRAINVASTAASGDYLFLCDADVILPRSFWFPDQEYLSGSFATISSVVELGNVDQILSYRNGVNSIYGSRRQGPGLILVSAEHFRSVGGMDSRFEYWGYEDIDLITRLEMRGLRRLQWGCVGHISHDNSVRNLASGMTTEESDKRNRAVASAKYRSGDLLGTLALDCGNP